MRNFALLLIFWGMWGSLWGQDSLSWQELNKRGYKAFQKGKYKEALEILKQAKTQAEKEFGKEHVNYAAACHNLAFLYDSQGLYSKANRLYIDARNIEARILGKNHPAYATSCYNLAESYRKQGLYSKAETLHLEAKRIRAKALGTTHPDYVMSCNNLASLYEFQRLYYKAESLYIEAKTIRAKVLGKSHPDYAVTCNNLAELYRVQALYSKAEPLYLEAKRICANALGKNHPDYAMTCNNLAALHHSQGLYSKAEPLYIEAKAIRAKALGKSHPDYAASCNNLAELYRVQGLYSKAKSLCTEAKTIQIKTLGKNHPGYAMTCNNLAVLYYSQGLYSKAKPLCVEAKRIRTKSLGKTHPDYAMSCNNLAELYNKQGLYSKAEPLYIEAKRIYAKALGVHHPDYAKSCNNLAVLYYSQGLYYKATLLLKETKGIYSTVLSKNHPGYAMACSNLATLYQYQGFYPKAEPLYIEAKRIYAKALGVHHPDYAKSCSKLAGLYYSQGLYSKAKPMLKEAKRIYAKALGVHHPDYANSCYNLAVLYYSQTQYSKVESLFKEAKTIYAKTLGINHLSYAKSCYSLAELYQSQTRYSKVESLYQDALLSLQTQIRQNLAYASEKNRQQFLKANVNHYFHIFNSFAQAYTDSLTVPQSKKVLALQYNNRLLTKALLFNSTQKTKERIYASGDTTVINQYEAFIAKRMFYNKMLELPITERKKLGIDLATLAEEANDLEKALARQSKDFAKELEEYKIHKWEEVKKKLRRGEVAIEIIRFHQHFPYHTDSIYYVALIVTPKSHYPYPVYFTNGNFLESKGFRDYQFFTKNQKNAPKAYARFWQPIQAQLKKLYPKVQRVFVSLDGIYHQLNLKTLWNPASQKYLGDELDICLVSNTKDLLKRKTKNKTMASHRKAEVQLFGYPDYSRFAHTARKPSQYDGFFGKTNERDLREFFKNGIIRRLPDTQKEVQQIGRILATHRIPHRVYLDTNATETKLKAVRSPKVLHLATHGYFINHNDLEDLRKQRQWAGTEFKQYIANPLLRAGLVWTGAQATLKGETRPQNVPDNGILTAQEVLNLNLDSTQLVVLSACETGLGKVENGRRVYGLQRAFLSAGAQYVLMSLWKVDDKVTNYFMQYFYEAWAKHQNVRQAHHYAQQQLRTSKRGKYHSPYYWGAFVLVGK